VSGITDVAGIRVGHATNAPARTGCTVVLGPFRAVCDVRGLGTGSRELETLSPLHITPAADAILLTGGSAYGLAAADGVMRWHEERGLGYQTVAARVPIIPAAVIYDFGVISPDTRPGPEMGRAACDAATNAVVEEGRVGAGTGATVGKIRGIEYCDPGGVGTWSEHALGYTVAALVVVNPLGDVLDAHGNIIAGAHDQSGAYVDSARELRSGLAADVLAGRRAPQPGTNTTLAIVATDAPLSRTALQVIARAASTGMARRINPVNTPFDGDVTFAVSTASEMRELPSPELLVLSVAASYALEQSIERAVIAARG
jgi:L-aminopeptidase/D-esterase-like protein